MKRFIICLMVMMAVVMANACKQKGTKVVINTTMGTIHAELYDSKAPETVKNFLTYVDNNFYNGTIFHRVIPDFMVQGGGFTDDLIQKDTNPPIRNEADNGLKNKRGTLAMARTPMIHSATSQFFINVNDNPFLDNGVRDFGYCVFGTVTDGMDIVDRISRVSTVEVNGMQNVPMENIVITSIRRE